ncbi:hypothetical protein Hanom_Chr16g01432411 [Helianthus anomalus]
MKNTRYPNQIYQDMWRPTLLHMIIQSLMSASDSNLSNNLRGGSGLTEGYHHNRLCQKGWSKLWITLCSFVAETQ